MSEFRENPSLTGARVLSSLVTSEERVAKELGLSLEEFFDKSRNSTIDPKAELVAREGILAQKTSVAEMQLAKPLSLSLDSLERDIASGKIKAEAVPDKIARLRQHPIATKIFAHEGNLLISDRTADGSRLTSNYERWEVSLQGTVDSKGKHPGHIPVNDLNSSMSEAHFSRSLTPQGIDLILKETRVSTDTLEKIASRYNFLLPESREALASKSVIPDGIKLRTATSSLAIVGLGLTAGYTELGKQINKLRNTNSDSL